MAKKVVGSVKKDKSKKPKPAKQQTPVTAKLTYTAEMEVLVVIDIMPGHTSADVLKAISTKKADFFHEISEIEVDGEVIATLSKPHLLNDEYDDFEIEPL